MAVENENKQDKDLSRKAKRFGCLATSIISIAFGFMLFGGSSKEITKQTSNSQPIIERTDEESDAGSIVKDEEYEIPNIIKSIPEDKRKEIYFALISAMDKSAEEAKAEVIPKTGD